MTAPLNVPSTISFARRRRGCPLKKIDVSAQTGDGGIALIHQQVNKMGFVCQRREADLASGTESQRNRVGRTPQHPALR